MEMTENRFREIYLKYRGYLVILGGVLVHLIIGTIFTFGNMSPYMTSYIRVKIDPTLNYESSIWILSSSFIAQGFSIFIGGIVLRKYGPRKTVLIGSAICSSGIWLTYFTINHSFSMTVLTYGAMFGVGQGICYAAPMSCAMKWLPEKKGLVNGLVVAGIGGGAFIFDPIQTAYLNPENKIPDKQGHGKDKYFSQDDILDRVPDCLLMLGLCYGGIQLIGALLLVDPPITFDKITEQTYLVEEQKTQTTIDRPQEVSTSYQTLTEQDKRQPTVKQQPSYTGNEKQSATEKNDKPQVSEFNSEKKSSKTDYTPREVLRSKFIYILWFIFLFNGLGIQFIATLYKAYGQTFITDDYFLAIVGSLAAFFNSGGRILWGILADRYSVRTSLMLSSGLMCILMLTFNVTSFVGKELYVVYVCLLFMSLSGNFALLPTATAKTFGTEHYGVNYGIVFTATIITSPISALLTSNSKSHIGWDGMFFMVAASSFISMILSWAFKVDRHPQPA